MDLSDSSAGNTGTVISGSRKSFYRHRLGILSLPVLLLLLTGCQSGRPTSSPSASQQLTADFPAIRCHAPTKVKNGEVVVMVHGLFRGSGHLSKLGKFLAESGYQVYCYDYESTRHPVPQHGSDLRDFLLAVAAVHPEARLHLVTHSLGGLLTRYALAHLAEEASSEWQNAEAAKILTSKRIGSLVMIAPPNRGSDLARLGCRLPYLSKWIRPLPDLSSETESLARQLPVIEEVPTGIIIARFDAAVKSSQCVYPAARETLTLGVSHSTSVYSRQVRQAVLNFLENGQFAALPSTASFQTGEAQLER